MNENFELVWQTGERLASKPREGLLAVARDTSQTAIQRAGALWGIRKCDADAEYKMHALIPFVSSADPLIRLTAIRSLRFFAGISTPEIDVLVHQLKETDLEEKSEIVKTLACFDDQRIIPTCEILLKEGNSLQRARAIGALVRLGTSNGIRLVKQLWTQQIPESTRTLVATRLARRGERFVESYLLELSADQDKDLATRFTALLALSALGNEHAASEVRRLLEDIDSGEIESIRVTCLMYLGDLLDLGDDWREEVLNWLGNVIPTNLHNELDAEED